MGSMALGSTPLGRAARGPRMAGAAVQTYDKGRKLYQRVKGLLLPTVAGATAGTIIGTSLTPRTGTETKSGTRSQRSAPPQAVPIPRDIPKDIPRDIPRDIPKDITRDIPRDIPKEQPSDKKPDKPRKPRKPPKLPDLPDLGTGMLRGKDVSLTSIGSRRKRSTTTEQPKKSQPVLKRGARSPKPR